MKGLLIDMNVYNYLEAIDEFGSLVRIPVANLSPFRLFGMDVATISELRYQYLKRNGSYNITVESVKTVYANN